MDKFLCIFMDKSPDREFDTLEEAMVAAENYCGNSRYTKPFPNNNVYLYGPGDGTTSVMVRRIKR